MKNVFKFLCIGLLAVFAYSGGALLNDALTPDYTPEQVAPLDDYVQDVASVSTDAYTIQVQAETPAYSLADSPEVPPFSLEGYTEGANEAGLRYSQPTSLSIGTLFSPLKETQVQSEASSSPLRETQRVIEANTPIISPAWGDQDRQSGPQTTVNEGKPTNTDSWLNHTVPFRIQSCQPCHQNQHRAGIKYSPHIGKALSDPLKHPYS